MPISKTKSVSQIQRRHRSSRAAELGAEVIAIEPGADTFALLENIALNGYQLTA